jgi:acyl-CoA synthetase (NDP forming)
MRESIDAIFNPASVAVIGASRDPEKWGNLMARSLVESDYQGELYLVNPKGEEVLGRKTYASVLAIEGPVDLAIIGIPPSKVPDAVRDCVEKEVKGVIIVTAHFGEYSQEGKQAERELVRIARIGGTRIVGPNCIGVYNSAINLNTTFSPLPPGPFAFLTQSGNLGLEISYFAGKRGLGFSKFASIGNQIDLQMHELLDCVKDDPHTGAILLYIEGLKDGRGFLRVAREATAIKPVLALKVGVSSAGARAAASHTGALAGSDQVYDAAFRQAGVFRVGNSTDLLDIGEALVKCPLPRGNRVGIICNGGGAGTLAADVSGRYGLDVPEFSAEARERMAEVAPFDALHATINPVDFADEADPWAWVNLAEVILKEDKIDALVTAGGYGGYEDSFPQFKKTWVEMAYEIAKLQAKYHKPVIVQSYFLEDKPESLRILREQGVPVYGDPDTAMRCLGALVERSHYLESRRHQADETPLTLPGDRMAKVSEIIGAARAAGRSALVETESRDVLSAYGLPVAAYRLAARCEDALESAREIGYPAVLKVVSPDILHKSDAGGVRLDLASERDLEKAFNEIVLSACAYDSEADIWGCLVSRMEDSGLEVIVGMVKDPTFGPTVMFGLGGIFCEVLKDVSFRVGPLTRSEAHRMVGDIKGYQLLCGARGAEPADVDAIVDVLLGISALAEENPDIVEVDLNPLFVFNRGVSIVDARIVLG